MFKINLDQYNTMQVVDIAYIESILLSRGIQIQHIREYNNIRIGDSIVDKHGNASVIGFGIIHSDIVVLYNDGMHSAPKYFYTHRQPE